MDLRTGKLYATKDEALADGVPASDLAEVTHQDLRAAPEVRFTSGPFKDRVYKRTAQGNLVRVHQP